MIKLFFFLNKYKRNNNKQKCAADIYASQYAKVAYTVETVYFHFIYTKS